jgi:hypothetical protein
MEERNREVPLCQTMLLSNAKMIEHLVCWLLAKVVQSNACGFRIILFKWQSNGTGQELILMPILELSIWFLNLIKVVAN